MSFLRELIRLGGMLQGLPGMFVPGLMVPFAVLRGGHAVRMRGQLMHLRGPLM
jgi:hypothetical protein